MNNIQNQQIIEEMSQMTKINSKYPKKNEEKIHCLQGANPVYHRGKGPPRGNSPDFFLAFCDVMGNPINRTEKNNTALMRGKHMKKNMGQTGKQPNFFIKN